MATSPRPFEDLRPVRLLHASGDSLHCAAGCDPQWSTIPINGNARDCTVLLFCRIHRSAIVNLRKVRGLQIDAAGEYEVILDGGPKLRLSRRFRKDLQARMRKFGTPVTGGQSDTAD